MDSKILFQLNEAYRQGVYEEAQDDLEGIEEWVESLIAEGYNLDDYTDDELYEAYLEEKKCSSKKSKKKYSMEESVDLYDAISEYLVTEGFCNSYEDSAVIMANMSKEWRTEIVNVLTEK